MCCPPVSVLDTNRARDGRAVRHAHRRQHWSPATVALTFGSMCATIGIGSTWPASLALGLFPLPRLAGVTAARCLLLGANTPLWLPRSAFQRNCSLCRNLRLRITDQDAEAFDACFHSPESAGALELVNEYSGCAA
jgi:hypothetical protein